MPQTLTKTQIEQHLPHREPILMVDEVTDWQADDYLTSTCFFGEDHSAFSGHFPGNPILPGVLQVEALAQASALLVALSRGYTTADANYLFAAIENARFKQVVKPNTTLTWRIKYHQHRGDLYKFNAEAHTPDGVSASAQLTAKVVRHEKS